MLANGVVLTKDNLLRRNWSGTPECYFCKEDESIDHLFFKCSVGKVVWACVAKCIGADSIPGGLDNCWSWLDIWCPMGKDFHVLGVAAVCWSLWDARNKACFDKKLIRSPIEIVYHARALMRFWAGLYQEVDKKTVEDGVNLMLKVAMKILAEKHAPDANDDGGAPAI